jgi:hypothetical protein
MAKQFHWRRRFLLPKIDAGLAPVTVLLSLALLKG